MKIWKNKNNLKIIVGTRKFFKNIETWQKLTYYFKKVCESKKNWM